MTWLGYNGGAHLLRHKVHHYTFLRYEDFVQHPTETLRHVIGTVTGRPPEIEPLEGREIEIAPQHILGGNPDKLERAEVTIAHRPWHLPIATRVITTALTAPLLARYGYLSPVRPPRPRKVQTSG